jgi:hypothetical protein
MSTRAFISHRALLVLAAVALVAAALTAGSLAAAATTAEAAGGYSTCSKKLKRSGHRFQVNRRKLSCDAARRKTKRVLKRKRAPRGWDCSLPNLPRAGSCWKGRQAFVFHRL